MLKYYEYLLKIKNLLHDRFSLAVLGNLDKFSLNTDSNLEEYYEKIAAKIKRYNMQSVGKSEKYYIQKNQAILYRSTDLLCGNFYPRQ